MGAFGSFAGIRMGEGEEDMTDNSMTVEAEVKEHSK